MNCLSVTVFLHITGFSGSQVAGGWSSHADIAPPNSARWCHCSLEAAFAVLPPILSPATTALHSGSAATEEWTLSPFSLSPAS